MTIQLQEGGQSRKTQRVNYFKRFFFWGVLCLCIGFYLHACTYATCLPGAQEDHKRVWKALKLELQLWGPMWVWGWTKVLSKSRNDFVALGLGSWADHCLTPDCWPLPLPPPLSLSLFHFFRKLSEQWFHYLKWSRWKGQIGSTLDTTVRRGHQVPQHCSFPHTVR